MASRRTHSGRVSHAHDAKSPNTPPGPASSTDSPDKSPGYSFHSPGPLDEVSAVFTPSFHGAAPAPAAAAAASQPGLDYAAFLHDGPAAQADVPPQSQQQQQQQQEATAPHTSSTLWNPVALQPPPHSVRIAEVPPLLAAPLGAQFAPHAAHTVHAQHMPHAGGAPPPGRHKRPGPDDVGAANGRGAKPDARGLFHAHAHLFRPDLLSAARSHAALAGGGASLHADALALHLQPYAAGGAALSGRSPVAGAAGVLYGFGGAGPVDNDKYVRLAAEIADRAKLSHRMTLKESQRSREEHAEQNGIPLSAKDKERERSRRESAVTRKRSEVYIAELEHAARRVPPLEREVAALRAQLPQLQAMLLDPRAAPPPPGVSPVSPAPGPQRTVEHIDL